MTKVKIAIAVLFILGWLCAYITGRAVGIRSQTRRARRSLLSEWLEFWIWAHQKRKERS